MTKKDTIVRNGLAAVRERIEDIVECMLRGAVSPLDAASSLHGCTQSLLGIERELMGGPVPQINVLLKCPYCGGPAEFVDSAEVYGGRSYGMVYLCRPCDAYVGCYPDGKPLGRLANKELRQWKVNAHNAFDLLLKGPGSMSKGAAYKWLADAMGLEPKQCHIGMFDIEQCRQVVLIVQQRLATRI